MKYLHLEVIDRELRRLVNPLMLLPPLEDTSLPVIRGIHLQRDDTLTEVAGSATIRPGRYQLVLDVYDPSEYVSYFCQMSPFRIGVYSNGQEIMRLAYQGIEESNRGPRLVGSSDRSYSELYLGDWLIRVGELDLKAGETSLEIAVADLAGNEVGETLRLTVRE